MQYRICLGIWLLGMIWRCYAPPLPGVGDLSKERAQRLLEAGVYSEAADVLSDRLRVHPDDVGAQSALARLLFDLQRFDRSVDVALGIPRDDPVYGPTRQHLLMRLRLHAAHTVDWDNPDAVLSFARLCSRMGSYERSIRAYRQLLAIAPSPDVRREYAAVLGWSGDMRSAVRAWGRYLEERPLDWDAWHQRARAEMTLGTLDEADRHLEAILERQPDNPSVMLDLARVRMWQGEWASADRLLETVWTAEHARVDAGLLRADLLLRLGEVEASHGLLREVIALAPQNRRARAMMQDLEASRRVDIARLRRRIERFPDATADRIRLIDILLEVDRPGAALREMRALITLRPDDQLLVDRVAQLESRQRRDIKRMMQGLSGPSGVTLEPERLRDWIARHPQDARAVQQADRRLPVGSATASGLQP